MRQTASRLNRTWLTILGVVLLLVGAVGILLATGQAAPLSQQAGLGVTPPGTDRRLFGSATASAFAQSGVVVLVAVVAVVIGLLGLAWLIAQIPRSNPAKPFRLHDDAQTGITRVESDVLTEAVEAQVKALPGVNAASAVLRGSAERPDLTLKVTADDRTDVGALLGRLHDQVAADLGDALDTRLARLGVQVEIAAGKSSSGHITL